MKVKSILDDLVFGPNMPTVSVIGKSDFSKEIRLVFKCGQKLHDYYMNNPIVIELFDGEVIFINNDNERVLKKGDLIFLDANELYSIIANKDSILRISIFYKSYSMGIFDLMYSN